MNSIRVRPAVAATAALLCLLALLSPLTVPTSAQPAPAAQRPEAALPRVHFVATGGTISNKEGGRLTADDLARSMPGVDRYARLTHEQFANVASSELTLAQWVGLSKRINHIFATDKELAGIVVTSGTDTLEETAFFLHLTVRDPRPVVVVGSMRNPSTVGYEGAANLLEGVRVAADASARNKGVLVVLNDEINSARNVTKSDALRLQTFRSRDYGQLGVVDRDRVVFFSQIVQRHNEQVEFDINKITELPRVDVIMVYQGASGDLIKAAVDNGAKGIVIAVAGAGATSGTQQEGLVYAASKGVFIVTSSRTGSGRVAPPQRQGGGGPGFQLTPEQQKRRQFTIAGEDHTPIKARVLLMVALTKTTDRNELQRIFSEY
ncbi:MAG TPA: asparaginase [Vicinamibacterales bacterium]